MEVKKMDKIEINENARKFILDKKVDAITIKMERAGG
jgi:hypothetical protein